MAERLAQLVIELATRPVAVVALPNFARLQGDPAAFRRGVITTLKTSTILGIPALAGLAMVSDSLVAVLGVEWRHAAPVLQILCGLGVARTFTLFAGPLLQAVGRPGLMAAMTWTLAFLNISGFTVAGFWLRDLEVLDQIRGIAAVRTGIFVLLYSPVNLFMLLWFSGNSPWRLLRAVMPSLLGAASVIASVLVVQTLLAEKVLPGVALVLAQVIAGGVAGLATLHATDSEFRSQFAALLGRLRGRPIAEPIRQGPGHE
jgi:hypothetical protein